MTTSARHCTVYIVNIVVTLLFDLYRLGLFLLPTSFQSLNDSCVKVFLTTPSSPSAGISSGCEQVQGETGWEWLKLAVWLIYPVTQCLLLVPPSSVAAF